MKWYGSLDNRIEERMREPEIKVGMGATEFHWSDRTPYEVVEVKDQKHISIRKMDHRHIGEPSMDNHWELISNPENPVINLTKRGDYWYTVLTLTAEDVAYYEEWDIQKQMWFINWDMDLDTIRAKGKQTKYNRMNIRVGRAEYYYDYEF